jgi:hypothetical protein
LRKGYLFFATALCCVVAAFYNAGYAQAEKMVFRQVSYPFLPSITSTSFYFTSDGLMWFSTASGLTSFDGTSVLYHSDTEEARKLEMNKIYAIAEDRFQNLYIGTNIGLFYFNRKKKSYEPIEYVFSDLGKSKAISISDLLIDSEENLYIGTLSSGFMIYNTKIKKVTHINLDSSKPDNWENRIHNTVRSLALHHSDQSKLWLGTFNGIYLFDKTTKKVTRNFSVINSSVSYDGKPKPSYDVQKMMIFNDSVIWFNSWSGGFCEYNSKRGTAFVHLANKVYDQDKKNFGGPVIPSFEKVSDSIFLIGIHSKKSLLYNIRQKIFYPVNISNTVNAFDAVTFITKDRKGNIWLVRNGMLYISMPQYGWLQPVDISKQITPNNIPNELRHISFDKETNQFYAAVRHSSGVYVFDAAFNMLKIIPTPLITNSYTYKETCTDRVIKDGSGRLWTTGLETYVKLPHQNKFDYIRNVLPSLKWVEKKGEFFRLLTSIDGDILLQGVDANVYIINHKTLHTDTARIPKFDYPGNFSIYNSPLLYDSIRALIYYTNAYGIAQYSLRAKQVKKIAYQEFLGNIDGKQQFLKIAMDDAGRIWSMREGYGIRIIDPASLKCIDSFLIGQRGLRLEKYSNIIHGGNGFMFLQGQNGVTLYNFKKQQSFLLDNTNGLQMPVPYSILYCNNHLVLGQSNLFQYYNTENVSKNFLPLQPRVNLILSNKTTVYERETADSANTIKLPYFQNNLKISFSASEFIFPERIEYAYQLSEFEDEWQTATYFKREVSYTRLQPGKYIFRLKAQLQGDNWTVNPVEYIIIIEPAWWQTVFFKLFVLTLLIGSIIIFFRYRIHSVRKKEKQKLLHEKQLLELEAKALRAQMNPHFIFNCMNSIKSLIQDNQKEKSVIYLTTFSKLIRTLFNNADKKEITLYDEIETCKLYLHLESMRFDTKFTYTVTVDDTIDLKSVQVPALIIQPFIENAIWHGIVPKSNGGNVLLNVSGNKGIVEITIDDNGIGREASQQNKSISYSHQSKGVNLTQARLELDNLLQQRQAGLETSDKKDEKGMAMGTKVIITIKEEI